MLLACAAAQARAFADGPPFGEEPPLIEAAAPPAMAPSAAPDPAMSLLPPRLVVENDEPDLPIPVHASRMPDRQMPVEAEPVVINLASIDRVVERYRSAPREPLLHVDDGSSGSNFVDSRVRSMALALDAPLARSGLTLQSRVEMAYRPGMAPVPGNWDAAPGEASATGLAVRLYSSKPTRLNGVYPFVEADWWQDNRARTININGTRIDTDLLRGLFSFNVGAQSRSNTGMKVWFKARGGRNAGATVGARYRW
ncbi:hypothetical protein [Cupriavidus agavae]|nr:hypothetical protein [Cupriavidus agavae]